MGGGSSSTGLVVIIFIKVIIIMCRCILPGNFMDLAICPCDRDPQVWATHHLPQGRNGIAVNFLQWEAVATAIIFVTEVPAKRQFMQVQMSLLHDGVKVGEGSIFNLELGHNVHGKMVNK